MATLKEVRPIQHVRVYSQTDGEAVAFAETMSASLKLDITVAQTPEAAIRGSEIAVTATNSRVPFFPLQWLEPDMHLSCMQRDEAQDDCFAQADVVVFHTREKEHEYVSTDFSSMKKQYGFVMRDHPPRDLDWNKFPDLGELVAGRINGREGREQRTLFLNSTGVSAQFTALADRYLQRSAESGLGHEVPTESFVEAIQP